MLWISVVGAGILGTAHALALSKRTDAAVVAICDLRLDAARALAMQVGAQAFSSVDEMLSHHAPGLGVVATPDAQHLQPTLCAIDSGVPNILQEKPLATNLTDARAIHEAVERSGVHLYVNYANRTAPLDIATCHTIREGLIGPIVYGDIRLDDNISVPTALWGARSRDWAGASSPAHFLLSHVVDLVRWYLHPAEITEVYALKQQRVLGYTPDLYDAYLLLDTGARVRIKAEWIRHMDELVEFYLSFSGAEGTLIYNKLPGFGTRSGWRANLSPTVTMEQLLAHQQLLARSGAHLRGVVDRGAPGDPHGPACGDRLPLALEAYDHPIGDPMALTHSVVDAILAGDPHPESWRGPGPLPNHVDGLKQSLTVAAIVLSAEKGQPVTLSDLA